MDSFASDRKLSELGELDLQDLLDQSDLFDDDDEHRPLTIRRRPTNDTDTGDCVSVHGHMLVHQSHSNDVLLRSQLKKIKIINQKINEIFCRFLVLLITSFFAYSNHI